RRRPAARSRRHRLSPAARSLPRPQGQRGDRDRQPTHPRHDRRRLVARHRPAAQRPVHERRRRRWLLRPADGADRDVAVATRGHKMQATLKTLLLLAIAFLIVGAGGALAQTDQDQDIACEDAAGGAESSNVCALEAWKKADAELNRIYR